METAVSLRAEPPKAEQSCRWKETGPEDIVEAIHPAVPKVCTGLALLLLFLFLFSCFPFSFLFFSFLQYLQDFATITII